MNRLVKIGLVIGLAVVMFGTYRYVSAQEGQSGKARGYDTAPTFHVDIPEVIATKHVLQSTYLNSGDLGGASFPANTFTPVDTQLTVVCPGTSGTCSIQADMLVQNGAGGSGNLNRVCLYVDGVAGPYCNYFADESSSDGEYINAVQADIVSGVAHGNHTVQMYFWTENGAGVAHYQASYHVYKP